jgi:hypothetical protein
MMKFALIGSAAVAVAAFATPALAQRVITNPGLCAQFYPNANCQDFGPGNPYVNWQDGNAMTLHHSLRQTHRLKSAM